ncbi:YdcF family protein [Alginatibacterium sediminis]|nr:ElyC/SanA/YdcF family protein [Alginatibacterium sediminis]
MPINVSLLLMLLALLLCIWKRPRLGAVALLPAIVILGLCSNPIWVNQQMIRYERQVEIPSQLSQRFDYIVVLGGAHISDPRLSATEQLSTSSFARISKGIELAMLNPGSRLIVSGYGGSDPYTNAELMVKVAQQSNIVPASIISVPKARNTSEEAELIASYIGKRPTALVTSATHMPRALKYFEQYSDAITAVPTDFMGKEIQGELRYHEYLPDAKFLHRFNYLWHEKLGIWWEEIRSKFS